MQTLDSVITHLAFLTALMFVWTLAIQHSRASEQPHKNQLLELLVASLAALVLMRYPVTVEAGFQIDLRMVPIALIGVRYTPVHALLAAVPAALFRLHLGGPGAVPGVVALLALVGMLGLCWLWARNQRQHVLDVPLAPWLMFLGLVPGILMLPEGPKQLLSVFPMLYLISVATFQMAVHMLHSRQHLLNTNEQVSQASLTDPLTGLGNRRKLDLDTEHFHGGNHILTLDVDHFKSINDHYGHMVGDQVLETLGTVLRESLGAQHQAYRLGGEEFVVVLRNKSPRSAHRWAEDIREVFTERIHMLHPHIEEMVTLSAGLVQLGAGEDFAAGLERADQCLYEAKRRGRDQTCHHADAQERSDPSEEQNLLRMDLN